MRRLPTKRTARHKQIIEAVNDFFGEGCPADKKGLKKNICLWIMGRRKGIELNEEQGDVLWYVMNNLPDYQEKPLEPLVKTI